MDGSSLVTELHSGVLPCMNVALAGYDVATLTFESNIRYSSNSFPYIAEQRGKLSAFTGG